MAARKRKAGDPPSAVTTSPYFSKAPAVSVAATATTAAVAVAAATAVAVPSVVAAAAVAVPSGRGAKPPSDPTKISRVQAKNTYGLSLADLDGLAFTEVPNPVRPFFAPMRVYKITDVQRLALEKHGDLGGIDAARDAAKKRKLDLKQMRADRLQAWKAASEDFYKRGSLR
jgi:hypothetical protein